MAGVIIDEEVTLRELHPSLKVEPSAWHTAGNALCKARSWLCTGGGFKMFQKGHGIFHICNDLCERWRFLVVACNLCLFTGRECSHGRFRKTEFVGMPCVGALHLFLHDYMFCCCLNTDIDVSAWKTPFRSSKGAIGRQSSAGLFSVKGPKLPFSYPQWLSESKETGGPWSCLSDQQHQLLHSIAHGCTFEAEQTLKRLAIYMTRMRWNTCADSGKQGNTFTSVASCWYFVNHTRHILSLFTTFAVGCFH